MELSIVIIAKDEEKHIARCIESVLKYTPSDIEREILLVDSCSSDKTVAIAERYDINIVQLKKNWVLTPSAGRFTGINETSGKYILMIDGDMELYPDWVKKALSFMKSHPQVGAVVGKQYDVYKSSGHYLSPRIRDESAGRNVIEEIDYVTGSSLFLREAIIKAGNFQPFLNAEEEAELSYRITKKDYRLYFLPYDAINHYGVSTNAFRDTLKRTKSKLYYGIGQMIRWCLQNQFYSLLWKRCAKFIILFTLIVIYIVSAITAVYFIKSKAAIFILGVPLGVLCIAFYKKRNLVQGIFSILKDIIILSSVLNALFKKVNEPRFYPKDVNWIKKNT